MNTNRGDSEHPPPSTFHPPRLPSSHPPSPQLPGAELCPTARFAAPLCSGRRARVTAPPPPPPPPPPPSQPLAPRRRQLAFRSEGSVDGGKRAWRPLARCAHPARSTYCGGKGPLQGGLLLTWPPTDQPHSGVPERVSAPRLHVLGPAILRASLKRVLTLLH